MDNWLDYALSSLIPALISLHLFCAPYTKVEESFNIQAIHDILAYGVPAQDVSRYLKTNYDHVSFPGSVPRTFVGAALLSGLSRPWIGLLDSPEQLQMLVRGILGIINGLALVYFKDAVDVVYGKPAGRWYIILQASQFHVMYYASRALPNMFAFAFTTVALRNLILVQAGSAKSQRNAKRRRLAIYLLTVAGVVFRSEIAILLAAETGWLLLQNRADLLKEVIPAGLLGACVGLLLTVSIDSFFWQQVPLWPELAGFYYNTVLGKSSEWGTSPFHFYFTDAIPRLLHNPMLGMVYIPLALWLPSPIKKITGQIVVPLLVFIGTYSLLPHKEWRFVIYTVPAWTATAAGGVSLLWRRRTKSLLYRLLSLVIIGTTMASFAASFALLYISSLNYPGGQAIDRLHSLAQNPNGTINVHMDNLACQTGVTRFLEKQPPTNLEQAEYITEWKYDKTEDDMKLLDPIFWQRFDYVLAEQPERVIGSWEIVDTIYGFAGIGLRPEAPNPSDNRRKASLDLPGLPERYVKVYIKCAELLRSKVTKGYWPVVRMETKIYILKKEH